MSSFCVYVCFFSLSNRNFSIEVTGEMEGGIELNDIFQLERTRNDCGVENGEGIKTIEKKK